MVNLAVALVALVLSTKPTAGLMFHCLKRWPVGAALAVIVTVAPAA